MARNARGHGSAPRITPNQSKLIDALFANPAKPVAELATIAGISERTAYYALSRLHIKAEIERRVREQITTKSYVRAINRLDALIDAQSEYVQADIAKYIAGVNGVRPAADVAPGAGGGITFRIVRRNADGTTHEITLAAGAPRAQANGDGAQLVGASSAIDAAPSVAKVAVGRKEGPGVDRAAGRPGQAGSKNAIADPAAPSPSHDGAEGDAVRNFPMSEAPE